MDQDRSGNLETRFDRIYRRGRITECQATREGEDRGPGGANRIAAQRTSGAAKQAGGNSFPIRVQASYPAGVGAHKAVLYLFDWFKRLSRSRNCTNYLRNALTGYIAAIE